MILYAVIGNGNVANDGGPTAMIGPSLITIAQNQKRPRNR